MLSSVIRNSQAGHKLTIGSNRKDFSQHSVVVFLILVATICSTNLPHRALIISTAYAQEDSAATRLFSRGIELFDAGDLNGAVNIFKRGLLVEPENHLGHYYLAEILMSSLDNIENIENARKHYVKTFELAPNTQEGRIASATLTTWVDTVESVNGLNGVVTLEVGFLAFDACRFFREGEYRGDYKYKLREGVTFDPFDSGLAIMIEPDFMIVPHGIGRLQVPASALFKDIHSFDGKWRNGLPIEGSVVGGIYSYDGTLSECKRDGQGKLSVTSVPTESLEMFRYLNLLAPSSYEGNWGNNFLIGPAIWSFDKTGDAWTGRFYQQQVDIVDVDDGGPWFRSDHVSCKGVGTLRTSDGSYSIECVNQCLYQDGTRIVPPGYGGSQGWLSC